MERTQRYNLGLSVPMLVFAGAGTIFRWPFPLLLGWVLLTGGTAASLIMMAQLRRQARTDATH